MLQCDIIFTRETDNKWLNFHWHFFRWAEIHVTNIATSKYMKDWRPTVCTCPPEQDGVQSINSSVSACSLRSELLFHSDGFCQLVKHNRKWHLKYLLYTDGSASKCLIMCFTLAANIYNYDFQCVNDGNTSLGVINPIQTQHLTRFNIMQGLKLIQTLCQQAKSPCRETYWWYHEYYYL